MGVKESTKEKGVFPENFTRRLQMVVQDQCAAAVWFAISWSLFTELMLSVLFLMKAHNVGYCSFQYLQLAHLLVSADDVTVRIMHFLRRSMLCIHFPSIWCNLCARINLLPSKFRRLFQNTLLVLKGPVFCPCMMLILNVLALLHSTNMQTVCVSIV